MKRSGRARIEIRAFDGQPSRQLDQLFDGTTQSAVESHDLIARSREPKRPLLFAIQDDMGGRPSELMPGIEDPCWSYAIRP